MQNFTVCLQFSTKQHDRDVHRYGSALGNDLQDATVNGRNRLTGSQRIRKGTAARVMAVTVEENGRLFTASGKSVGQPPTHGEIIRLIIQHVTTVADGKADLFLAHRLDVGSTVQNDIHVSERKFKTHRIGGQLSATNALTHDLLCILGDLVLAVGQGNVGIIGKEHMRRLRNDAIGQLGAGLRNLTANAAAVDRDGYNIIADMGTPIGGDGGNTAKNAELFRFTTTKGVSCLAASSIIRDQSFS